MYSNASKLAFNLSYRSRWLRFSSFSSSSSTAITSRSSSTASENAKLRPIPFKDPKPGRYNPPTRRIAKIMYALLIDPRKSGFEATRDRYVAVEDLLSHPDLADTDILTIEHIVRSDVQKHFHFLFRARPLPNGQGVGTAWVKARVEGENIPKTDIDSRRITHLHQILRDPTISVGGKEWSFVQKNGIPRPEDKPFITLHERWPALDLTSFPPRPQKYTHIYLTVDPSKLSNRDVKMYYLEKSGEVLVTRKEDRLVVGKTDPVLPFRVNEEEGEGEGEEENDVVREARGILEENSPTQNQPPPAIHPLTPSASTPPTPTLLPKSQIPQSLTILLPPSSLPSGRSITQFTITARSIPFTPPKPTDVHIWNRAIWKEPARDVRGLGRIGERYFEEQEEDEDEGLEDEDEEGEWERVVRREKKVEARSERVVQEVVEEGRQEEVGEDEEEADELVKEARGVFAEN